MFIGIASALVAGTMLGLYALPGKYTKGFEEENKWSLFFILTMFVVPLIATFALMKGVGAVYSEIDSGILVTMVVASFLWGCGVMMWGKAIDQIGLSLGMPSPPTASARSPVVVYAIFNTTCLVVAVISGIATGEWIKASAAAKRCSTLGLSAWSTAC